MSAPEKVGEQDAVVWVRRSDWERVTLREEFVGRFKPGSRLPQYLYHGDLVFDQCRELARGLKIRAGGGILYHGDVDWGCGAGAVNLMVCHIGQPIFLKPEFYVKGQMRNTKAIKVVEAMGVQGSRDEMRTSQWGNLFSKVRRNISNSSPS